MSERRSGFKETISYRYHQFTKHTLQSLHSSSHRLDWNLQPDPFRRYDGSTHFSLPEKMYLSDLGLFHTVSRMNGSHLQSGTTLSEACHPAELNLQSLSTLLYFSMSLSAWKQVKGTEHKWALRVNPSSGNLHPTETHILVGEMTGISSGAYHYYVKEHQLEKRSSKNVLSSVWNLLECKNPAPPLMLVLNSIFWREAWKYQDRAFRYCQLDLGHAAAAICLSTSYIGWGSKIISEFPDQEIAECLGISEFDEKPMLLIPIYPQLELPGQEYSSSTLNYDQPQIDQTNSMEDHLQTKAQFIGVPNLISSSEVKYESIKTVYEAGHISMGEYLERKAKTSSVQIPELDLGSDPIKLSDEALKLKADPPFRTVVRTRRSAVDMDGKARCSLVRLARILIDSTRGFNSSFSGPDFYIHILIYSHRVDGLAPGVYYFEREQMTLNLVHEGNVRTHAKFVSCLQDIAADGIFAVSLIADMQSAFQNFGERAYRYIHQEAGFIGQLFYLCARALDIDATGIGCFIDDEINNGLPQGMEVVYNFTFGKAVLDERLTDLPAYSFPEPGSP